MYKALAPMLLMGISTYLLFRSEIWITRILGIGVGIVAAVIGLWCVRGIFSLEAAADQYYGGAIGEYDVGLVLSRLPHEFHVFHGLGFYAGDVDHVVVGPTGIFVVETKNHSGTISLRDGGLYRNGELLRHDFVHQATSEAIYVKRQLKTQVPCHIQPLVVFSRAKVRIRTAVFGVRVIPISALMDTIADRGPVLSSGEILRCAARLNDLGIATASRSAQVSVRTVSVDGHESDRTLPAHTL